MTGERATRGGFRLERITLQHAGVRFRGRWVLRDISFELRAGEAWLLLGPNGAGKTLLLRMLRGEIWPTPTGIEQRRYLIGGEWHDQPLMARERIAYLGPEQQDRYQRHGWDSSVAETVATGLFDSAIPLDAVTRAQWRAVRVALDEVGLAGLATRRFLSLSQGQRRRVLLARALVRRPDVLLLDEVLNGLDAASSRALLRHLRRLTREGMTWVLSSHRPLHAVPASARVAWLERGRLGVGAPTPRGRSSAPAGGARWPEPVTPAGRLAPGPLGPPTIVLQNVSVYRDGRRILSHLDWVVGAGEHWRIVGSNGAGKSTLIALLFGDLAPALGGRLLRGPPGSVVAIEDWKQQTGLLSAELQALYATTACSVQEIIVSGLYSSIGLNERPLPVQLRLARDWMARVGLQGLGRRCARELSYGQLRLALLARALVCPRRLLLLDEPFDGLDAQAVRLARQLFDRAVRGGAQVILATHHAGDVPPYVRHRLELGQGTAQVRAAGRAVRLRVRRDEGRRSRPGRIR